MFYEIFSLFFSSRRFVIQAAGDRFRTGCDRKNFNFGDSRRRCVGEHHHTRPEGTRGGEEDRPEQKGRVSGIIGSFPVFSNTYLVDDDCVCQRRATIPKKS